MPPLGDHCGELALFGALTTAIASPPAAGMTQSSLRARPNSSPTARGFWSVKATCLPSGLIATAVTRSMLTTCSGVIP